MNRHDYLDRRAALGFLGQAALFVGTASSAMANRTAHERPAVNAELEQLKKRLASAPRRRQFKSVPFVVHRQDQWDHEAAELVLAYSNRSRQVWECTDIGAPWLNLMREAINGQVFAHGNPGFLAVAAVHGTAHLALFDQAAWDQHNLAIIAGEADMKNVYFAARPGLSSSDDLQNLSGYYGPENNNISTLQERGMVFIACHDSIHAIARNVSRLSREGVRNADEIAADLTNHLVPRAVLVPSVVAFLVELQRVGFTYAKGA